MWHILLATKSHLMKWRKFVTVRQTYDERLLLIGPALNGRMLVVILGPTKKRGVYYPVTARPASKKERNLYRTNIGGST